MPVDVRQNLVVIGAGQAGLAVSRELTGHGIEHVVFERGRVGQTWRDRWDSFRLVTPNWTVQLPGHPYDGDNPDGFMPRDDIAAYLDRYADGFDAPVREGIDVTSLDAHDGNGFRLRTNAGEVIANKVVVATGAYQRPHRPPAAATLAARLPVIDLEGYTNPGGLPEGGVLVIGSGQSGCQLAEELQEAGREVFLACGKVPWAPRRIGERDVFHWLVDSGYIEQPVGALPSPMARLTGNPQATGHGGGHDLTHRTLQASGVHLLGRFTHADESRASPPRWRSGTRATRTYAS
jgi:putative flavoprotein involved in K+ transport